MSSPPTVSMMHGKTMLTKRMSDCVVRRAQIPMCRCLCQLLAMIICGLLGVPVVSGEIPEISQKTVGSVNGLLQRTQSSGDFGKRHNPFTPIHKRRSIPSLSKQLRPLASQMTAISTSKDPNWKLLSIIHGQYGQQAVIQVSSRERIIVRPGMKLTQSGWIVQTISKGEVLLEHLSTPLPGEGRSRSKTFILSFPALGKSH